MQRLHHPHPGADRDLRDRGVRPHRRARPVRPDQSRPGGVLRLRRLRGRPRHRRPAPELLGRAARWASASRVRHGRLPRHDHAAPRRPLPGDGDDQLPADRDAGHGQLDSGHARPRRRRQDPAAAAVRVGARLPRPVRVRDGARSATSSGACRRRRSAARCARCATTSSPPASPASTSIAPRSRPSRSRPCSAASAAACSPAASPTSARTSSASPNRSCSSR